MLPKKILFPALASIVFMLLSGNACYSNQTEPQDERYVHHEFLYGTARIDYIEQIMGRTMVTCYYKYDDPQNRFHVTSVEIYSGSRYNAGQLLSVVRYIYDGRKGPVRKRFEQKAEPKSMAMAAALTIRPSEDRLANSFDVMKVIQAIELPVNN